TVNKKGQQALISLISLESYPLQTLTIVQLKKELRFRNLSLTGIKKDLILRIVEDNNKRISDGTLDELNILRMQSLNDDEDTVSDNSQLLTEIEYLRKQVELLSNSSKQSPLPMPPPSQVDPNIAAILSTIMETQKQILERQDDNIGLCSYVEFKIELQRERPIRCRPYRLLEPDRQFLKTQIQKWFKQGISRHSTHHDQQRTFESLKIAITTAPIISYFKQGLPTFVETDASYSGLDAVLSQEQNGKRHVMEYASRSFKDNETRYRRNELECTATHWART
ncbi:RT_RNaseH_2 domain-containing protein, partial [Trichonephila inaurata madagascariensis]